MIAGFELINLVAMAFIWSEVLGAGDFGITLTLALARAGATSLHLRTAFAPIRLCEQRGSEATQAELEAAERAFSQGRDQVALGFLGGWVSAFVLATVLTRMGLAGDASIGVAELVPASIAALGFLTATVPALHTLLGGMLRDMAADLARVFAERGIPATPRRRTFVSSMLATYLAAILGVFLGTSGVGGAVRIQALLELSESQQLARARLAASETREARATGRALELPPGVELVGADALDPSLGRASGSVVYDRASGQMIAAAPVGDGRYAVARGPADIRLGELIGFVVIVGMIIGTSLGAAIVLSTRISTFGLSELRQAMRRAVDRGEFHAVEHAAALSSRDIGELVADFNVMVEMIDGLTAMTQRVAAGDLSHDLGHDLGHALERPGPLHDAVRSMIARLRDVVEQMRLTSEELGRAVDSIGELIQAQREHANEQLAQTRSVGSTVASLSGTAKGITSTAKRVFDDAERSLQTTDEVLGRIAELRREVEGVGGLLENIREVADRSDLLALNGSLEATRAGEAGRGFAIVAGEMRRLAERVGETVNTVRGHVSRIEQAGVSTVSATSSSRELAERTANAARKISTVTTDQFRHTREIADALAAVSRLAQTTAGVSAETMTAVAQLEAQAERLDELLARFDLS